MRNPAKESDENALPDPELNPLLNPLLAANMGRWAEVYFTTPPERREQAIADLLRELESSSPAQSDLQVIVDESESRREATETETDEALESPAASTQSVRICDLCGHGNREEHKFCGMCGAPLETLEERVSEIAQSQRSVQANADDRLPRFDPCSIDYAIKPEERFTAPFQQNESVEHAWPQSRNIATDTDDVPHFEQNVPHFASELPHFPQHVPHFADNASSIATEHGGIPYRYRVFVGMGLAILLAALIYMARRGTGALSDAAQSPASRVIPAAQPAPTQPGPTQLAPAQPAPAASEPPAATGNSANSEGGAGRGKGALGKPWKVPTPSPERKTSSQNQPSSLASTPSSSIGGSPSAQSTEFSGTEDLAMAEKYLNGTQGRARDRKEAVQLLWRAVGKGNPAATIVLSDLYLRGDGVPKSCDQAHLLLDAAARKGVKGAADRLRNMQAFGCQ